MATHTMEEKYKTLKVADLRAILVSRGCTDDVAKLKKQELIDKMLEMDEQDAAAEAKAPAQMEPADMPTDVQPEQTEKELPQEEAAGEENRESGKNAKENAANRAISTVERQRTGSWKCWLTVTGLSVLTTICRGMRISMLPRRRSANLLFRQAM